jgi:hypothetical protein
MKHEGNNQDKETKARAFIQSFKAYRMKKDEFLENVFFQMTCRRTLVLDKGYSTSDHTKAKKFYKKTLHLRPECELNQNLSYHQKRSL